MEALSVMKRVRIQQLVEDEDEESSEHCNLINKTDTEANKEKTTTTTQEEHRQSKQLSSNGKNVTLFQTLYSTVNTCTCIYRRGCVNKHAASERM